MENPKTEQILSQIALSLLSPPSMLLFVVAKSASLFFEDVGESAEEIFRGERLPIINHHES